MADSRHSSTKEIQISKPSNGKSMNATLRSVPKPIPTLLQPRCKEVVDPVWVHLCRVEDQSEPRVGDRTGVELKEEMKLRGEEVDPTRTITGGLHRVEGSVSTIVESDEAYPGNSHHQSDRTLLEERQPPTLFRTLTLPAITLHSQASPVSAANR